MSTMTVEQLYEQVKPMSTAEQLRLVAMITQQLATRGTVKEVRQHRSTEPGELSAETGKDVDTQKLPVAEVCPEPAERVEPEANWRTEWEELAKKVSAAWNSDKGAVETLIEMRR